ncbi:hypothetical protein BME81_14820 [Enterobacter hormaechei subsp. steigerwaltii]|nr:hypothetical protein BME81_14820 [Enterobacter hormaechei subsp. steigerwaltii]
MVHPSSAETPFQLAPAFSALLRHLTFPGGASLTGATCAYHPTFLCFTYNPGRVMKLSYNGAFLPEATQIVCYNRASFIEWTAFSHGFRN